ncbi:MAG: putative Na+/H+ antiporter [Pelagibacterales bacterium]|nr:putative Na+/H+ antiporter [Pelagibacterales bacterium]
MSPTLVQSIALIIFVVAILHTFSVKFFKSLAQKFPRHHNIFDMLGEVEIVFGFWAIVLVLIIFFLLGKTETVNYLNNQSYVEPLFVFVIMVIAASKPILDFSLSCVKKISALLPVNKSLSLFLITMSFVPLLGSFITEPAAMTLAALILRDHFYSKKISNKFKYGIIGTLFVNVSIGGAMTPFAAPPILMVAAKWNWDLNFMINTFAWRTALAVFINSIILTFLFRNELTKLGESKIKTIKIPFFVLILHLILLLGVIFFVHDLIIFLGIFLIFLAVVNAFNQYQDKLIINQAFLVSLFLAGLVVLGGQQKWWLQTVLAKLTPDQIYYVATALTAVTDNAALTYLASLVDGLSDQFKYAIAAGAITGGGLTVIANAPNPAGYSILNKKFSGGIVSPLYLFLSALGPTIVAIICYKII